MDKIPVKALDSPGFIVNRVARHFYLQSLKLVEDGITDVSILDNLMQSCGFRMGPFRLMDLIGIDVNYAVTESLYYGFDQTIRFKPSSLQEQKLAQGALGRKSGKGFYDYSE